jgi:hypothetical protein
MDIMKWLQLLCRTTHRIYCSGGRIQKADVAILLSLTSFSQSSSVHHTGFSQLKVSRYVCVLSFWELHVFLVKTNGK